MDLAAAVILQAASAVAALVLISAGLALIFGMMRVINLAHGEFLMLGGYATILAHGQGLNLWLAALVVAPLVVGAVGYVVERLLIRHLYDRRSDTLLATWGLSLLLIGLVTMLFGNTTRGVSAPLGAVAIGDFSMAAYELALIGFALAVVAMLYLGFARTRAGLVARATMQNPDMAEALGTDRDRVYAVTFTLGAALSGLAGGLLAPLSGVVPTIGAAYVAKAFITVIAGGAAAVGGTVAASVLLGSINSAVSFLANPVIGEVALLLAAIILLRLMPEGISGRFFRGGV
jgi:urea transport system permease protein